MFCGLIHDLSWTVFLVCLKEMCILLLLHSMSVRSFGLKYAKLHQSCLTLSQPHGLAGARVFCPWDSPAKNIRMGCHILLQGIFQTHGSNPHLLCLLHWQAGSLRLVPPGKTWVKVWFNSDVSY